MKSIFDTTFINATNYNWFYKLIGRKDEYISPFKYYYKEFSNERT